MSAEYGWRWVCSPPAPLNFSTVVRLWVPLTHSQSARHVNCASSGISVMWSRAPSRASTLTPLSTAGVSVLVSVMVMVVAPLCPGGSGAPCLVGVIVDPHRDGTPEPMLGDHVEITGRCISTRSPRPDGLTSSRWNP